jgi:hypothetical protein
VFESWYSVGHVMTRSLRKAMALQAARGGRVLRHVSVNGKVETFEVSSDGR